MKQRFDYQNAPVQEGKKSQNLKKAGFELYKDRQFEKALKCFQEALKTTTSQVELLWGWMGSCFYNLNRYSEAVKCYDQALKIDPKYAVAAYNKGMALDDLGLVEDAILCYDEALKTDDKDNDAWNNKGFALNKLGRYEEAIVCLDKAIGIDPVCPNPQSHKGLALCCMGFWKQGMQYIERALILKDDYANGWSNKAVALFMLGNFSAAIECLDKVINPTGSELPSESKFRYWKDLKSQSFFLLEKKDLKQLFSSRNLVDSQVLVQNTLFQFHRAIISVRCPKLLYSDRPVSPAILPSAFESFLSYLYCEEFPSLEEWGLEETMGLYLCVIEFG